MFNDNTLEASWKDKPRVVRGSKQAVFQLFPTDMRIIKSKPEGAPEGIRLIYQNGMHVDLQKNELTGPMKKGFVEICKLAHDKIESSSDPFDAIPDEEA